MMRVMRWVAPSRILLFFCNEQNLESESVWQLMLLITVQRQFGGRDMTAIAPNADITTFATCYCTQSKTRTSVEHLLDNYKFPSLSQRLNLVTVAVLNTSDDFRNLFFWAVQRAVHISSQLGCNSKRNYWFLSARPQQVHAELQLTATALADESEPTLKDWDGVTPCRCLKNKHRRTCCYAYPVVHN